MQALYNLIKTEIARRKTDLQRLVENREELCEQLVDIQNAINDDKKALEKLYRDIDEMNTAVSSINKMPDNSCDMGAMSDRPDCNQRSFI